MNKKETPKKIPNYAHKIWNKSKPYTVKEYKGNRDCQQYVKVEDVFKIVDNLINSAKKEQMEVDIAYKNQAVQAVKEECAKIAIVSEFKDGEKSILYEKEFDEMYWQQGRLLDTSQTIKWNQAERENGEFQEKKLICVNFYQEDLGKGRTIIYKFQNIEDCRKAVELHNNSLEIAKAIRNK